jgi:hypothetical protein
MTMPHVCDRFMLAALLSLAASLLPAAEPMSAGSTTAAHQLKALRDQTIIQSRQIAVVLSATVEKQLDGSAKKFEVNFAMTYYFEK